MSWNAYKNDPQRNPPKTIDVEFVCDMDSERTEIWRRLDTGGYLMRKLCNEPFARWLVCRERQGWWEDGACVRPNITFRHRKQTEKVRYDDWNETAAYLELDVAPADRARADMATDAFYALWDAIRKVSDDLDRLAGDCRVVDAIYAVNDVRRRVGTLKTED